MNLAKMFPFWESHNGIALEIVGMKRLEDAKKKHGDIRSALNCWINEVKEANWKGSHDVKARYASASFMEENKIFFNIKGTSYRLLVQVEYLLQLVVIEWIGTHAEYTKKYC